MNEQRQSPQERYEYGRSLREHTPLESHGDWSPGSDRPDPVELIEGQNVGRIPWLVPVRRARMSVSAFTFYRGTAVIMASDLAQTPVSGLQAQICGDAHLANFGAFASPERRLVFDINDFDETLPGPWEWDVKRLAASFVIAGRHNGLKKKAARDLSRKVLRVYRKAMAQLAKMPQMDVWYSLLEMESLAADASDKDMRRDARATLKKAKSRDSRKALKKLAETVDGKVRIKSEHPLLVPLRDLPQKRREEQKQWIIESYEAYLRHVPDHIEHLLRQFRVVDHAVKVVGVGSVGTRCSVMLLLGRDQDDPLFLQIKQANPSVLENHLRKSRYDSPSQRVVEGQHLMQTVSDIFLGWSVNESTGNAYYFRQLKDWKYSADVDAASQDALASTALLRGWTLARSHARTGDPIAIAAYLGDDKTFDKAVTAFADRYADQNDADYAAFVAEIDAGRLEAGELES